MKKLALTGKYGNGKFVLVDDEDFSKIMKIKSWRFPASGKCVYTTINRKTIFIHRFILGITDPKVVVDHIDRNPLNNQRVNLRACSSGENSRNRKINKNNTSGYKGVCIEKTGIRSVIYLNSKRIYLGYFPSTIEAAKAYNEAALKYHGEFASLNEI